MDSIYGSFSTENNPLYMIMIYSCMAIFGVVGNVITCIVIASNKSMHTATNCYLFNLAVSDLLLLFLSYPPLNGYVNYNSEFTCKLRCSLAESSVYVSVLTISVFSVERYVAICHPFLIHTLSKLSRTAIVIPLIWLIAMLSSLPLAVQLGLVYHVKNHKLAMCTLARVQFIPYTIEIVSVVFFIVPMILMALLYLLIGRRLSKSRRMKRNDFRSKVEAADQQSTLIDRSTKRVLRMLVTVVAAFFICWAPFHIQRIASIHFSKISSRKIEVIHKLLTRISGVLFYSSAIINPVLYNIMSKKFRQAFKDTLIKSCKIFQCINLWTSNCKTNHERSTEHRKTISTTIHKK